MAPLVKHLTLHCGSDHDLTVREFEPISSSVLTVWSLLLLGILSLSPTVSALPLFALSLLKINLKISK